MREIRYSSVTLVLSMLANGDCGGSCPGGVAASCGQAHHGARADGGDLGGGAIPTRSVWNHRTRSCINSPKSYGSMESPHAFVHQLP
eukprot:5938475-Pyramimonas_sp.AAC.2